MPSAYFATKSPKLQDLLSSTFITKSISLSSLFCLQVFQVFLHRTLQHVEDIEEDGNDDDEGEGYADDIEEDNEGGDDDDGGGGDADSWELFGLLPTLQEEQQLPEI